MLIRMAARNLTRHTKRTILTLVTIMFGIFVGIFGDGLNSGLKWQIGDSYIKTQTSNIKIYKKEYYNPDEIRNPLEYTFNDEEKLDKILKSEAIIKKYSKRLVFSGNISNGAEELRANYVGIDYIAEQEVFDRRGGIISGKYFENNEDEKIIIGLDMASAMGLKTGDTVTISTRSVTRTVNAYDAVISGIIRTGNPMVDSMTVFLPVNFAKKFADTEKINDVAVFTGIKEDRKSEKMTVALKYKLSVIGLEMKGWYDETKDLLTLISFRQRVFNIITAVVLIMAAAGITNTMLMAMLERKKEIGIMMANGMSRTKILALFLLEGAILGIIGSGIALLLGYLTVNYFQINGLPIPVSKEQIGSDVAISDKFYFYFDVIKAVIIFMVGVVVAALASFYPALKAVKLEPVDAIKG